MNSPNEQSRNQDKHAAGEAISRQFLAPYAKSGITGRPLLYCGHLGSRAELEIRLWKYVEAQLSEEEEQAFWRHAENCLYCQSRIRDIAQATCQSVRMPDLLLRLERITARVKDNAGELLADVLVAVENTGRWLSGRLGAGLVLRPVPVMRGLRKNPTLGPLQGDTERESPVNSVTPAFKVATTVEGVTLTCAVTRAEPNLILSIGYGDAGSTPELRTTCRVDSTPVPPIRTSSGGIEFVVPPDARRIEFTTYRREHQIGCLVVELEQPRAEQR